MTGSEHSEHGLVLVTGAAGFLGRNLCRHLTSQGYRVRALVREPAKAQFLNRCAQDGIYRCNLPRDIDAAAFEGNIRALVHCAYADPAKDRNLAEAVNIGGSAELLRLARNRAVEQFVFISSLSAHDQAESFYGRSKLRIEQTLDLQRDLILRPGLVIGEGGLYARMRTSLERLGVVPLFFGGKQQLQTIDVDTLCAAIEHGIRRRLSGMFRVASREPVSIREFYRRMAAEKGRKCRFVHLPGALSLGVLRCCEALGLDLPVSSENLLGLKQMRLFETASDLARLGIEA